MLKAPKDRLRAMILIPGFSIEGNLSLPPHTRLTDFINTAKQFIPVTDAKVLDTKNNSIVQETPFVELNRDFIISIVPVPEKIQKE